MAEARYKAEAEKILVRMRAAASIASATNLRILAEALEQAEKRGREMSARLKESSG